MCVVIKRTDARGLRYGLCPRVALLLGVMVLCLPTTIIATPFWGSKTSQPIDMPINQLKKGEFLWLGNAVTAGPEVMIVSLTEQRAYVYRNGILIGASTVSTGRPGHLTPTGVFTVLQKRKEHRSSIYDAAPMPYMERLTWGGIALHAGGLPGFPQSHGCVHLPSEFAKLLFAVSPAGMTVVISSDATTPEQVAHPGYLAPVTVLGGHAIPVDPLQGADLERWHPELSTSGPISIVLSRASQLVVAYRDGIEIGRSKITIAGDEPIGGHVLVLVKTPTDGPIDPYVPDPTQYRWLNIKVPGDEAHAGVAVDPAAVDRIKIPSDFVHRINGVLTPGTTLLVIDDAISAETSGSVTRVIDANPPANTVSSVAAPRIP